MSNLYERRIGDDVTLYLGDSLALMAEHEFLPNHIITDLASAVWVLRKRARDEKRLADLRAAMAREIEEETQRIRASYETVLARAERNVSWWSRFDDQLEFLAHAKTMDSRAESVAIGSYRIGFRTNPGGLALRDGVVTKTADPKKDLPLLTFCAEHAPAAIKTERSFLISELKKVKDLDPVKAAPELFEHKPAVRLFYVDTGVTKSEKPATIQPSAESDEPS